MQNVTAIVAAIGSLAVLLVPPAYALGIYIGALVWYPYYLTLRLGTYDFMVGRIVILVLCLRCVLDARLRRGLVRSALDKWVILLLAISVVMAVVTRPFAEALENRSGFLLDTAMVYLCARMIIRDRRSLHSFVKVVALFLAPLAFLGFSEALSGRLYFAPLKAYSLFMGGTHEGVAVEEPPARFGLTRATGPFGHSIMFGATFAMFIPLVWSLRHSGTGWRRFVWPLCLLLLLGGLSSMASGPWMMMIVLVFCLALESYPLFIKPLLWTLAAGMLFVSVVSNRTFYHVVFDYLNPLGGTGWQRARLIDAAIDTFGEWWLKGYGGRDPGWGRYCGMGHTDLNNQYLLEGVKSGIWGTLALVAVLYVVFRQIIRMYKSSKDKQTRSVAWALGATFVGIMVIFLSVSLFGQPTSIFYCLLGITGSLSAKSGRRAALGDSTSYAHVYDVPVEYEGMSVGQSAQSVMR